MSDEGDTNSSFDFTDTVPPGPGTFAINGTPGTNIQTFAGVIPGTYTVTETVPAARWDLTNIACTTLGFTQFDYLGSGSGDTDAFQAGDTRVEINFAGADDTVQCTFTNTERGSIEFTKVSEGDVDTFDFVDLTAGTPVTPLGNFTLDTDGVATQQFTELDNGTYVIEEDVPTTGWDLTDVECNSADGTSVSTDVGPTLTIELAPGDDVDCTFTNTKRGTIDIAKTTVGGTGEFDFTHDVTAAPAVASPFTLDTAAGPLNQELLEVAPDTYTVTEDVPEGWIVTGIVCTSTNEPVTSSFEFLGGADDVDNDVFEAGDHEVKITLGAGDDVGCSFENTQLGAIYAVAYQDLDASETRNPALPGGSPEEPGLEGVEFTLSTGATANTDANGEVWFDGLVPGDYSIIQTNPSGFTQTTPTSALVALDAGEVEVAYSGQATLAPTQTESVNSALLFGNAPNGEITIVKDARQDSELVWVFNENITPSDGPTEFELIDDGESENSVTFADDVSFGEYIVTETSVVTDWDLSNIECTSIGDSAFRYTGAPVDDTDAFETGDTSAVIDLAPGDDVSCTFTNDEDSFIIVNKVTDPTGDPAEFGFDADWIDGTDDFFLSDGGSASFENLDADEYAIMENDLAGWDLTDVTCVSSFGGTEDAGEIDLEPGETVTCTFTNTKRGAFAIVTDSVPDDSQDFSYNYGNQNLFFDLDDDGEIIELPASKPFDDRSPGVVHQVSQLTTEGWDLTNIECTGAAGTTFDITGRRGVDTPAFEPEDSTVKINLAPGDLDATCVFTNTKRGSIVIEKEAIGGDETFTFSEDVTEVGSFPLTTEVGFASE